jgi:myo-inositol-1(or 4)-monophosphatase
MSYVTEPLLDVVREAGQLALRIRADGLSSSEKLSKEDIVTNGDTAVSRYLRENLPTYLPGVVIVDEEDAKSHDFSIAGLELAAVVDPIDGTTKYFEGNNNCGVSVGITVDGEPIAGIVYQFGTDQLFWAERGQGAFCNGTPLRVSTTSQLSDARMIHSMPYRHRVEQYARMEQIVEAVRGHIVSLDMFGSQVIELMQVALGKRDFFLMNDTKPWDVAGAIPIICEAGGLIVNMKGQPYKLGEPSIIATNSSVDLDALIQLIREE